MLDMSMTPDMSMRVTPALLNLAHLLTLPTMALHQAIQQELAENPALEEVEASENSCARCGSPIVEGLCLRCAFDTVRDEPPIPQHDEEIDQLLFVAAPRNLTEVLLADLYASLPESEHMIALALVGNLDDQGFLPDDPADIAAMLNVDLERLMKVLYRLRELGPPGIATRNTRECLLAQLDTLETEGLRCPHARVIIETYLDDLGARRNTHIARQLHISTEEVEAVRTFIQRYLWPYPAQAAQSSTSEPDRTRYRTPDLAITAQNGGFVVEVLHSPTRLLRLTPLYQELARQAASLADEDRAHVQEYVARARMFLANLRQRESTLKRIGQAIVSRQEEFLRHGVRALVPMTRSEIAAELGLHESTVSRATADKTALLPNGEPWPLSEFFVAARSVQDVLRELIANEQRPQSDQELAQLLTERGYPIARRTVAKYREQLKIPPSHLR